MPTKTFTVAGLTSVDCAERVQAAVCQVEGVSDCQVDHATGTLTVSLATPELPTEQIAKAVESAGYTLATQTPDRGRPGRRWEKWPILGFARFVLSRREMTLTAVPGLLTLLGLTLTEVYSPPTLGGLGGVALFAAAIVVGGIPVARNTFQELWLARSLGINTLMVTAVLRARPSSASGPRRPLWWGSSP